MSNNSCWYGPASTGTCWPGMAGLFPPRAWLQAALQQEQCLESVRVSGWFTGLCLATQPAPHPKEQRSPPWIPAHQWKTSPHQQHHLLVWGLHQDHCGSGWATLARPWHQACTTVLRSSIHRAPAPRVGSASPSPLLPALALSIRCHIHHPTLLVPSCPALSPPGPPLPCPMAASSGSWVTFSLQLLEAPPCPLPLCLEWNGASFVTVSFKRSNLFLGVTWLLCQQLLVLAQLRCSCRSCQSRMRHPCPLVLGVLSVPSLPVGKVLPVRARPTGGCSTYLGLRASRPLLMERGSRARDMGPLLHSPRTADCAGLAWPLAQVWQGRLWPGPFPPCTH